MRLVKAVLFVLGFSSALAAQKQVPNFGEQRDVPFYVHEPGDCRLVFRHIRVPTLSRAVERLEAARIPSNFGEQRTLVILVSAPLLSLSDAQAAFFGPVNSLDSFFRESSYAMTWFTGEIFAASVQIPMTCDSASLAAIQEQADAVAVAQGADLDVYTRRVYVVPSIPCPWSGFSSAGWGGRTANGTVYSIAWLKGLGMGIGIHEMGHGFDLSHASTWNPFFMYGDPTDAMGAGTAQFNAPHKEQLQWITAQTVTVNGTYLVTPLELQGGMPLLKVAKPDTAELYFVSYRQPIGAWDGRFSEMLTRGASIHIWRYIDKIDPSTWPADSTGWTTKFVDTTPGSVYGFIDAPLVDGASFYDAVNRIQITQLSHTPAGATVSVAFNVDAPPPPPPPPPAPCIPRGNSGKCK